MQRESARKEMSRMKIKSMFWFEKWYKQRLTKIYKFLIHWVFGQRARDRQCIDYIVIYGNGRFKAGLLLGIVLLSLFLLLSFISIAIWAAINNSNTTGQRRMMLIISAYLMICLLSSAIYIIFQRHRKFWLLIRPVSKDWWRRWTAICMLLNCRKVQFCVMFRIFGS